MSDQDIAGGAPAKGEFVISRIINAPRERVFKAWTDAEDLKKWWGPKGFGITVQKVDLRPGGVFHYGMTTPDGKAMWGRFIYREIVPPQKLVFVSSFSDEKAGLTRNPWSADWPLETLSTLILEDQNSKTRLTMRGIPINASDKEIQTFADGRDSMRQGWTGTLDQLDAHVKQG